MNRDDDYINFLYKQLEVKDNVLNEIREIIRMYELQSKAGKTNNLDEYVLIQRLKNVLDKGEK